MSGHIGSLDNDKYAYIASEEHDRWNIKITNWIGDVWTAEFAVYTVLKDLEPQGISLSVAFRNINNWIPRVLESSEVKFKNENEIEGWFAFGLKFFKLNIKNFVKVDEAHVIAAIIGQTLMKRMRKLEEKLKKRTRDD